MSNGKEGVMAAIMAAIDQREEEESLTAATVPKLGHGMSLWQFSGLQEMMGMRVFCQLRMGKSAIALPHRNKGA